MSKYKIRIKEFFENIGLEIHKHPLVKFFIVFIIFLVYFGFAIGRFGAKEGLLVGILTWTFFVLCTPIADAGFILDLPVRVFTGLRMVYSEMIVWVIAIITNISVVLTNPAIYESTKLLSLSYYIITNPIPFWFIIILSAGGSFLSLIFGDELVDIFYGHKKERHYHLKHKEKHKLILIISLFIILFAIYDFLLHKLAISISLF